MASIENTNNRGPNAGLEIYARNIKNDGKIVSDSYAKIVTENYEGQGEVVTNAGGNNLPSLFWWSAGIAGGLLVAYLTYLFGWN